MINEECDLDNESEDSDFEKETSKFERALKGLNRQSGSSVGSRLSTVIRHGGLTPMAVN